MTVILSRKGGGGAGGGAPTGPAGGDLAGAYPNPTIAPDVITSAEIDGADASAIRTELSVIRSAILFDSTLGADAASIDTGAGGVVAGYGSLLVYMILRTTEAVAISTAHIRINGNSGNNYDRQILQGVGASATAGTTLAAVSWLAPVAGANALANAFTLVEVVIPFYTATTALKGGRFSAYQGGDDGTETFLQHGALTFRSSAAVTQLSITAASGNLLAGSRMQIIGLG